MEAFGAVISRPIPSVSGRGTGVEPQPRYPPFSASFRGVSVGIRSNSSAAGKSYRVCSLSKSVFSDQSHVDYYSSGRKIRCRALEEKKKVKGQKDMIKKELKRIEVLSKDLALQFRMGFYSDKFLIDPFKDAIISEAEAAEKLQGQLQQLRLEEKSLKQSLKAEKRRLKAEKMQKMLTLQMSSSSSSSQSSDSSDNDCGSVVTTNRLDCKPLGIQIPDNETLVIPSIPMQKEEETTTPDDSQNATSTTTMVLGIQIPDNETLVIPSIPMQKEDETTTPDNSQNATSTTIMVLGNKPPVVTKKIEVCMGGKCKKSGASLLMEKFQSLLDAEAVVCGCKCMGKCRDGPNVRISENLNEDMGSVTNHLLQIGVALEDVDLIVEKFLGGRSQENLDLAAATAASY